MRLSTAAMLGIVLVSFILGIYFYPQLPERVASHWNVAGEVDGYMDRFWGTFLMPFISVLFFFLFIAIPRIDPLKQNIEKFRKHFERFVVLVMAFLLYVFILTILANIGVSFNLGQLLMPALGVLFFYAGIMIEHTKRNWFIGIRTPWTLSSDRVWSRVHRRGGKMFKLCGAIVFLGVFVEGFMLVIILVPLFVAVGYLFAYSYFLYNKEQKK